MSFEPLLTSVTLGLLASSSPCLLPLYPGFLAYLSGQGPGNSGARASYFLGLFVLAGVLATMLLLGLVIALLAVSIGQVLAVVIPISDVVILALGVLLLLNRNPFKRLPQIQAPIASHPFVNAFIYGMLYGPLTLPCSGPLAVGIFALSFGVGDALGKLAVFVFYGVGFGLPLLVLSFLAGSTQRWVTQQLARHARPINIASGLLLVAVAVFDLANNWEMVRAVLGLVQLAR
ncbi:MAG: hypothetical protein M1546_03805 [Chloroflexi bacterium]|nr:hypothetical protein [Chloroflexota bacterium]